MVGTVGCAELCFVVCCAVMFLMSVHRERLSVVSQAHPSHTAKGSHARPSVPTHHTTGTRRSPRPPTSCVQPKEAIISCWPTESSSTRPAHTGERARRAVQRSTSCNITVWPYKTPVRHREHHCCDLLTHATLCACRRACAQRCSLAQLPATHAAGLLATGCCSPGAPALTGLAAASMCQAC